MKKRILPTLCTMVLAAFVALSACEKKKPKVEGFSPGISAEFVPYKPLSEKYTRMTKEEIEARLQEIEHLERQYEVDPYNFVRPAYKEGITNLVGTNPTEECANKLMFLDSNVVWNLDSIRKFCRGDYHAITMVYSNPIKLFIYCTEEDEMQASKLDEEKTNLERALEIKLH